MFSRCTHDRVVFLNLPSLTVVGCYCSHARMRPRTTGTRLRYRYDVRMRSSWRWTEVMQSEYRQVEKQKRCCYSGVRGSEEKRCRGEGYVVSGRQSWSRRKSVSVALWVWSRVSRVSQRQKGWGDLAESRARLVAAFLFLPREICLGREIQTKKKSCTNCGGRNKGL